MALSTTPVPVTPSILQSVDSVPVSKLVPEIVSVLASVRTIAEIVGLEASNASRAHRAVSELAQSYFEPPTTSLIVSDDCIS